MQSSSVPSAETLMARFQERLDSWAFEQLVSCYMKPAVGVARQILTDHALAEDAVQESFLRVIRKRKQYIPASPFSSWFYTIVRNVCMDMLRKCSREKVILEKLPILRKSHSVRIDSPEIPELLGVLARSDQDVLVLRIVYGLGFRDVAATLGISEEAAKKRAQRALRRLRAKIHDSKSQQKSLRIAL
jgi:RNA polymerase sigma-70 factor (ECF subfamily)